MGMQELYLQMAMDPDAVHRLFTFLAEDNLAETCREDVIWSRKPVPLKVCGERFDPDDLRAHLQETLDVGRDYFIEFVFRDTNRLTGDMADRIAQTCDMVRDLTGHPEGSRP